MTDKKQQIEWDKLPAIVETTSFRKTSDDFTFLIATPKKYEEYAKIFMARLSSMGVIFFVPCAADQIDNLLAEREDRTGLPSSTQNSELKTESCLVPVELLAEVLGMTPRNAQLQAEKGLFIRSSRGQYDTLATCAALWKALKEAETGKNDAYNEERTAAMRLKRLEREREHEEAMKHLVNYEALLASRESKNAIIKQKLLFLEKSLPPRLNLLPANQQEPIIRHEVRKLLTEFAVAPVPGVGHRGSGQDIPSAAGPDRKPVGRRKKKARKQNKR